MEDGLIAILFLKVSHLQICLWALDERIRDGWHLWVGEGGQGFTNDSYLTDFTVRCSEVSLQFLHFSGELVG